MPKDNIDRAIKKGEGNDSDSNYEEIRYEGYGPSGVAIIVEAMTNNKNRTAAEIRSTFNKFGGSLGENGSVSHGFKRFGEISLDKKLAQENEIFEFAVNNESKDLEVSEDAYLIYCNQDDLHALNEKIMKKFGDTKSSQLMWKSENNVDVQKDAAEKLFKLLNTLEDNEDVQSVSSNFEVNDEILQTLT
jgi:YebC/PmpR family DNA-binding regulatory protein